jgi:hypothetical protein
MNSFGIGILSGVSSFKGLLTMLELPPFPLLTEVTDRKFCKYCQNEAGRQSINDIVKIIS